MTIEAAWQAHDWDDCVPDAPWAQGAFAEKEQPTGSADPAGQRQPSCPLPFRPPWLLATPGQGCQQLPPALQALAQTQNMLAVRSRVLKMPDHSVPVYQHQVCRSGSHAKHCLATLLLGDSCRPVYTMSHAYTIGMHRTCMRLKDILCCWSLNNWYVASAARVQSCIP